MKYFDQRVFEENIANNRELKMMVSQIEDEVKTFFTNFNDDVTKVSLWGHYYFCRDDGAKLIFNPNDVNSYHCPVCHKNYRGELYQGAWYYLYRHEVSLNLYKAGILYCHTKDNYYLENITRVLSFYANNYLKFALHDKEGTIYQDNDEIKIGTARLMPQAISEAIFTVKILQTLQLVKDFVDPKLLSFLKFSFFDEVTKLLKPQINKANGRSLWAACAIGIIGLLYNSKAELKIAFELPHNIYDLINQGISNDGFWIDDSLLNNFINLEALINLLLFSKLYQHPFDINCELKIMHMLISGYNIAFDNGSLPSPAKMWSGLNIKTFSYIYATAVKFFGINSEINNIFNLIEKLPILAQPLPLSAPYYYQNKYSLEHLIFTKSYHYLSQPVKMRSINYPQAQFAMLRGDKVNVFLKYGNHSHYHAHHDNMNIEFTLNNQLVANDPGCINLTSPYNNSWYQMSLAHNSVVVNGSNHQLLASGKLIYFDDNQMSFTTKNVYGISAYKLNRVKQRLSEDEFNQYLESSYNLKPKSLTKNIDLEKLIKQHLGFEIDFTRTIKLNQSGFSDDFLVSSKEFCEIDYIIHINGELISEIPYSRPATLNYDTNGYELLKNVRWIAANSTNYQLKWQVSGQIITFTTNLKNKSLYLATSIGNRPNETKNTLIIRYKGKRTKFSQNWQLSK